MEESNARPELGDLVWKSPDAPPAPKLMGYVLSGVLMALAAMLLIPIASLFSTKETALYAALFGAVVVLPLAAAAVWIFNGTRRPKTQPGVLFFETGIEFGRLGKRRAVRYTDLASIRLERVSESDRALDRNIAAGRLAISIATGNPTGIGYALGKLNNNDPAESFVIVKPKNEREFRVGVFDGATAKLAPLIGAQILLRKKSRGGDLELPWLGEDSGPHPG